MIFKLDGSSSGHLARAVTVADAISDLPALQMGEGAEEVGYTKAAKSEYAQMMRNPEGKTFNHYAAKLSKQNAERMKHIPPGGSWRDIPF